MSISRSLLLGRGYTLTQTVVATVVLAFGAVQAKAQDYAVTNLSLGGSFSYATDMNESGQVVGYAYTAGNATHHAFVADSNGMRDLGTLGGNYSYAAAINEAGQIVGYATTTSGADHAFLHDGTTMHDLGTLGGNNSYANAINEAGHVVGYAQTVSGSWRAFLYDGTTMQDLGSLGGNFSIATAVNDAGQVAGYARTASGYERAFLYDGSAMHDLGTLGGNYSVATAINNAGQVVGYAYTASGYYHGFLYDGTTMHDLTLGGNYSWATGFNEAGEVVGWAHTASGYQHAFLYDGVTMHDLGTLGGNHSGATAVSEVGHVVGYAYTATGNQHAFLFDGTTMRDLGTLGGNHSYAAAINDGGHVVGQSLDNMSTTTAFLYDGAGIRNLNDHIPAAPAGTHLVFATRISDNGSIVAYSNAGWVLLSASAHAPAVGPISLDVDPVPAGAVVTASAAFTDADTADTHTANWIWGDASGSTGVVSETGGSGNAVGAHAFVAAGIYPASLTITDTTGLTGQVGRDVVVYDPSAGFVTGGGWIMSPMGAYKPNTALEGPATFGFVSKYQKGATLPTGNTEFQFHAADLRYHAADYEWLVVAGARAQYKGKGTLNGANGYQFMLTAVDGDVSGNKKQDQFRIKIWYYDADLEQDVVIYDNQIDPSTEGTLIEGTRLGGGSIVIHAK